MATSFLRRPVISVASFEASRFTSLPTNLEAVFTKAVSSFFAAVIMSVTFFAVRAAGFLAAVFGDLEDFFDFEVSDSAISASVASAASASLLSFIFS